MNYDPPEPAVIMSHHALRSDLQHRLRGTTALHRAHSSSSGGCRTSAQETAARRHIEVPSWAGSHCANTAGSRVEEHHYTWRSSDSVVGKSNNGLKQAMYASAVFEQQKCSHQGIMPKRRKRLRWKEAHLNQISICHLFPDLPLTPRSPVPPFAPSDSPHQQTPPPPHPTTSPTPPYPPSPSHPARDPHPPSHNQTPRPHPSKTSTS